MSELQNLEKPAELATKEKITNRNSRTIKLGITSVTLASVTAFGMATPASAETVGGTYGQGLSLRAETNTASTKLDTIPEGAHLDPQCFKEGQDVLGDNIWHKVNHNGQTGFVSDYYLYGDTPDQTRYYPTPAELEADGIPRCDNPSQLNSSNKEDFGYINHYNGEKAAQWALEHSKDVPPDAASCTQFVSRALWYAGVRETKEWNDGYYEGEKYSFRGLDLKELQGTVIAWRAEELKNYLANGQSANYIKEVNWKQYPMPDAEVGDVLAYDWQNDGATDHLAMVVGIAPGDYPEVAEWGVVDGSSFYQKRGWSWSEVSGTWLQDKYPNASIELIKMKTSSAINSGW